MLDASDFAHPLDEVLVLRCLAGDSNAFKRLVERYHDRLLYFVRRMTGTSANADDIIQDVWLAVYQGLPRIRHVKAFRVWLYRIARNKALRAIQAPESSVTASLAEHPDVAAIDDDSGEDFTAEDAADVHRCLDLLGADHREVLILRFLEEMPYEQIATVVGRDLGTIKSRIHYAKRALRREMEQLRCHKNKITT